MVAPWHTEFSGQGSDPSLSCDLCCSCSSARSFNPVCQPMSWRCTDTADPLAPHQELLVVSLYPCTDEYPVDDWREFSVDLWSSLSVQSPPVLFFALQTLIWVSQFYLFNLERMMDSSWVLFLADGKFLQAHPLSEITVLSCLMSKNLKTIVLICFSWSSHHGSAVNESD